MKKIAIIGAGPGGLAAGMVLSKKYEVHIFEKDNQVGGRSKKLTFGDYHFDAGPTFLMYIDVLKEVFETAGYDLEKELTLMKLEQLYTLRFKDVTFNMRANMKDNFTMYESYKKGLGSDYLKWYDAQTYKFKRLKPILGRPFTSLLDYFRLDTLKALPIVHPFQSVYKHLSSFNKDEYFIHSLSFQAKYLGMASYQAPSIFTMLPYLEHGLGLYHVKGGLNQINHVMAKLIQKSGGMIHLNSKVENIIVSDKTAKGVIVNGEEKAFDYVVLNADFAYAMTNLIDQKHLKKYRKEKLEKKKYSISTLMIYLGLDQVFDFAHHEILFSNDYETYLKGLMKNEFTEDISLYMHNPSRLDATYAKKGHSSLYLLIPVPNLSKDKAYDSYKHVMKERALDMILDKHGVDLRPHIQVTHFIDPFDWQNDYNVYKGAVFNLAHGLDQMLHKRPHNQFEEIKSLYLVGGGTHPGSGLPTIYQSALILKHYL